MQVMAGLGRSSFRIPTPGGDAVVTLRRRMKRLRMRIEPGSGRILISAPPQVRSHELQNFVDQNTDWILESQTKARSQESEPPGTGQVISMLGKQYTLQLVDYCPGQARIVGSRVELQRHDDDPKAAQRALDGLFQRELRSHVEELLARWVPRVGVAPSYVGYRAMRTRWGSCTPQTRRIRFSLTLATRSASEVEYVVVHELIHLVHPDHGAGFWRLMDQLLPDWKRARHSLRTAA